MGFLPGGVVALAKQSDDTLTAVGTGDDGRVNVAWVVGGGSWTGPIPIGANVFHPAKATSGALLKTNDHTLVFAAAGGGHLYTSTLDMNGGGWFGPEPIDFGGPSIFLDGAPVAMAKQSETVTTVMAVGRDGRLYVAWFDENGPRASWQGPDLIGNPLFPPQCELTLARQSSSVFSCVAVGLDRRMNVAWLTEGGSGWAAPVPFGEARFGPGVPVAMTMPNDHRLTLLAADAGQPGRSDIAPRLNVAWVDDGDVWQGPYPFGSPVGALAFGSPNGQSVAVARQSDRTLTAVTVNDDGQMCVAWQTDGGDWNGPVPFGGKDFLPGTRVSLCHWHDDVLAAVAVDRNGRLNLAWVKDGDDWNGPYPV